MVKLKDQGDWFFLYNLKWRLSGNKMAAPYLSTNIFFSSRKTSIEKTIFENCIHDIWGMYNKSLNEISDWKEQSNKRKKNQ